MHRAIAWMVMLAVPLAGCGAPQRPVESFPLTTDVESMPWNSAYSSGKLLRTKHYRIYTTTKNPMLLAYLPGYMEAAYQNYLRLTGLAEQPLTKRLVIYVMASRQEWAALTKGTIKAHQDKYLGISAGGYCYKGVCVFWDLGRLRTFSVAAHEGLHQFLHHRLKDGLPMWLEEGLCVSAEGHDVQDQRVRFSPDRNPFRFSNLREAILREHWIPIDKLLAMDAGDVSTGTTEKAVSYYGQLWALSRFIRSHPRYSQGFQRMLADAEAGRFHEALHLPKHALRELRRRGRIYNRTVAGPLFRYYIAGDMKTFDKEYLEFARKSARLP